MNSKRNIIQSIILLLLSIVFISCDAVKDATQFDISYTIPDQQITVDTTTFSASGVELLLAQETVTVNLDSLKDAHDLEGFEAAEFDYLKIELENPSNINLDWIQGLSATISTANIAETEVASYTRTGNPGSVIELTVPEVAVLDYLLESTFTIKVYGTANLPLPAPEIDMLLKSKLKITVQPI